MAWWSESSEEEKCSGTVDNLLIDRMVCQDSQRGEAESEYGLGGF